MLAMYILAVFVNLYNLNTRAIPFQFCNIYLHFFLLNIYPVFKKTLRTFLCFYIFINQLQVNLRHEMIVESGLQFLCFDVCI